MGMRIWTETGQGRVIVKEVKVYPGLYWWDGRKVEWIIIVGHLALPSVHHVEATYFTHLLALKRADLANHLVKPPLLPALRPRIDLRNVLIVGHVNNGLYVFHILLAPPTLIQPGHDIDFRIDPRRDVRKCDDFGLWYHIGWIHLQYCGISIRTIPEG